jgi:hypothetical protein
MSPAKPKKSGTNKRRRPAKPAAPAGRETEPRRIGEGNVPQGEERPVQGEYGNKERRQRQGPTGARPRGN